AGMGVALMTALWVMNELSYDKFIPGYENVYQLEMNLTSQHDGERTQSAVSLPPVDILRKQVPGIQYVAETDAVGMMWHDLLSGEKKMYLAGGSVNPNFLKIINYPFLIGNPETALTDPSSIVLTESTAKAFFGNENPINKVIKFDN